MSDRKIDLSNTLALFNLIRILEDWLIAKSFFFSLLLLPLDLMVLVAVVISRLERWVSYRLISGFLRYLHHDLRFLRELVLMVVQKDYISEELTQDPTAGEKELHGKAFKRAQMVLRFFWSFVVFLLVFPLLPVLWLWNYLARTFFVGWLYYLILFYPFPLVLQVLLFSIATFMVAISTVPFLFGVFVYVKSLFELESRSFQEIKQDADTIFLRLYKYSFDDDGEADESEQKPKGGIYYLFLKTAHGAKDHTLGILRWVARRRSTRQLLDTLKLDKLRDEVIRQLEERRPLRPSELLGPVIAFLITFAVAFLLVFVGAQGQGILGSLMLSVVDTASADRIWFSFVSGMGYLESHLVSAPLLSGLLGGVGFLVDQFFGYLFIVWHSFIPPYLSFIGWYYFVIGQWFIVALR